MGAAVHGDVPDSAVLGNQHQLLIGWVIFQPPSGGSYFPMTCFIVTGTDSQK